MNLCFVVFSSCDFASLTGLFAEAEFAQENQVFCYDTNEVERKQEFLTN
jgi:hypothetical protein